MKRGENLSELYAAVIKDDRLTVQHVCVYMGLCYWWTQNKCQNPVSITRKIVMEMSKIKSIATYHKCMKDLHDLKYIKYLPSFHPDLGSTIYLEEKEENEPD